MTVDRYFPRVAILSLESSSKMCFYREVKDAAKTNGEALSLFLERTSLLVFTKELYSKFKHSIPETTVDVIDDKVRNSFLLDHERGAVIPRGKRVSLTFRYVP